MGNSEEPYTWTDILMLTHRARSWPGWLPASAQGAGYGWDPCAELGNWAPLGRWSWHGGWEQGLSHYQGMSFILIFPYPVCLCCDAEHPQILTCLSFMKPHKNLARMTIFFSLSAKNYGTGNGLLLRNSLTSKWESWCTEQVTTCYLLPFCAAVLFAAGG